MVISLYNQFMGGVDAISSFLFSSNFILLNPREVKKVLS